MPDDLFLDPPDLDEMPECADCGEPLLPAEHDTCVSCDVAYYARVVEWIKGDEDRDLALAYGGVRPALH